MVTKTRKVTKTQAEAVLKDLAKWLGKKGYTEKFGEPAPTGLGAFSNGTGPLLMMDRDGDGVPRIVMEGVMDDWAIQYAWDGQPFANTKGVFIEPYASYELCLYREDN